MTKQLEYLLTADGYDFNADEARIRCMPHTVHLAALEVSTYVSCSQANILLINTFLL